MSKQSSVGGLMKQGSWSSNGEEEASSSGSLPQEGGEALRRGGGGGFGADIPAWPGPVAPLEKVKVYVSGDMFFVAQRSGAVAVDRYYGTVTAMSSNLPPPGLMALEADGVLGIVRFWSEQFIAVCWESVCVGVVGGVRIMCIKSAEVIPFELYADAKCKSRDDAVAKKVAALERALSGGGFFFSPDADITRPLGRQAAGGAGGGGGAPGASTSRMRGSFGTGSGALI